MNIKQTIKKVLSENLQRTIERMIERQGILSTISFAGDWKTFNQLYGQEITTKFQIQFIKEIAKEYGGISVFDLNEDPIFFREGEERIQGEDIPTYEEIVFFGHKVVEIQVWDQTNHEDLNGYYIGYEALYDDRIGVIFNILLDNYYDGVLDNL